MKQKKTPFSQKLPLFVAIASALAIVGGTLCYKHIYDTGYKMVKDQEAGEVGTYSKNVNVLLTRPDDWHKISADTLKINSSDLKKIDGSTATIPITAELARQFCDVDDSVIETYIDHNTTGPAYENLILGHENKKLIFVTEPSDEELALAEENNVEMDVTPVALDGFVFITHKDNPVESLTVEQVQKIYSGEITNWKEVGGNNEKIIPYQREKNSGSQTAMENIVMNGIPMMEPAESYYEVTAMGELIDYISAYHNSESSLGYTFYYYLNNLYKSEDVKVLKINGISPDNEQLISGEYPFTSAYYAVTVKNGDKKAQEIKDFLLSDTGQEMIQLAGYCPVR